VQKLYPKNLFVYFFNSGIFLMVVDIAFVFFSSRTDFGLSNKIPFSVIGLIICLISIPFLMIEWIRLPLGTHSKRIKLYQGAGNLLTLLVLTGGWLWREESFLYVNSHINELTTLTLSSGGLFMTILFGWLGGRIAVFLSRKQMNIEKFKLVKPSNVTVSSNKRKIAIGSLVNKISSTPVRQH